MNSDSIPPQKGFFKVVDLIEKNLKIVLLVSFVLFLFIPINIENYDNLWTLIDGAIGNWVNSMSDTVIGTDSSDGTLDYLTILVGNGIERTIIFFQNGVDFYIRLLTLDISVITQAGILLTCIYVLIPLIIIYLIWKKIAQNRSIMNSLRNLLKLSPIGLMALLLILPIPPEYTWIGAIIAFLLLLYWLYDAIIKEKEAMKEASLLEVLLWKKCTFVLASAFILFISVYEKFSDTRWSVATFIGIKPNDILIISLVLLLIIWVLWLISQMVVNKESLRQVIMEKYDEHIKISKIVMFILLIVVLIPLFDVIYIQNSAISIVFVIINIPWMLAVLFHDPFFFVEILVTAVFSAFNILYTVCRDIVDSLIPVNPSQLSIISSIEPTIILTMCLFTLFLIIIIAIFILRDMRIKSDQTTRSLFTSLKKQSGLFKLILACISFTIVSWIFKPENYESLFGDSLKMVTDPFKDILVSIDLWDIIGLCLISILFILVISIIYWTILQFRKGRSYRIVTGILAVNILAAVIAFVMVTPFIWMIKNSVQTVNQNALDFQRQGLLPDPFTMMNYAQIFGTHDIGYAKIEYMVVVWLFNSLLTAVIVTGFLVIFSAMAGYCLAKRDFIGKKVVFAITVAILMVPPYVQVIPLYMELNRLGFVGSLLGIIFPFLIQPFSVFLCTEFMRSIPDDYLDAARIDGYSEMQIFRKIVLPLSLPVISVMIVINFIANWNSFLWPLLILDQPELRTLPLGMNQVVSNIEELMGVMLALATVIVIPIFVILFLAQDYVKRGVTVEGLKG